MGDLLSTKAGADAPACTGSPSATAVARWQKTKEIFGLVLDSEAGKRAGLLWELCAGDESMMGEVSSLLASAGSGGAATSEVFKAVSFPAESVVNEREDPMLGRRVGDYRIERRVGYGGMAAVYLASRADEQFKMQAAIKLLRPDPDREDLLQRFLNERQTLAALAHPNIVKLLDGGSTEEGLPYLVMDYVDGLPIDQYCDAHNLSIRARLELFVKVCGAVDYAHAHSVIHRDLKPNNILVTDDGIPKLLDFGIAKVLDPDNSSQTLITRTASRHLTPAYASPEQVRGESVTAATDIYSLGVVLYSLLSGHGPYRVEEQTPVALQRAICEQDPESPSTAVDRVETEKHANGTTVTVTPEDVSRTRERPPERLRRRLRGDLDNIVLTALQKEPQRRYRAVSEFARDIQRHLEHKPIVARPSTLTYRASSFVRRHRTEVIASALGAVVSLGAIGYSVWAKYSSLERTRIEAARAQASGRRSVAVLGFKNLSGQPNTAWLSSALSEMLITELAAGGKLRVIPGETVARTKLDLSLPEADSFPRQTLKRLFDNLGTDYVLVGSYLDKGDVNEPVRYELRLQDAVLGETVASTAEAGAETALADVVTRIGVDLRAKLGISPISPADSASIRATLPGNPDATRYYAEGLAQLRVFNAAAACDSLDKAVTADPSFPLAHSALAEAWTALGYDVKARQEAALALDLSTNLPREDRLLVEARSRETMREWDRVVQIYSALFEFFPDNIEYGIRLAYARISAGNPKEAQDVIASLHKLPAPLKDDPRIDLLDARFAAGHTPDILARLFRKANALGATGLMAQGKLGEGSFYKAAGDQQKALSLTDEARRLFAKIGDENGVAQTLSLMGDIYIRLGDKDRAREMYEQELAICRASENELGQTRALGEIGTVYKFKDELDSAENVIRESIRIARNIQSKGDIAFEHNNLSGVLIRKGDLADAKPNIQQAKEGFQAIGDPRGVALTISLTAEVLYAQGDLAGAERACVEALGTFRGEVDKWFEATVLATVGKIRKAEGKLEEARKKNEQAEDLRRKTGTVENVAISQVYLAGIAIEEQRFQDARQLAGEAEPVFRKSKAPYLEGYAQALVAQSLLGEGKSPEAHDAIVPVLARSKAFMQFDYRLAVQILGARVLTASTHFADRADLTEATALLNAALADAKSHGYLTHQFDARLALGEIHLKSGNVAEGRKELAALEHDARAKGFMLVARKAASAKGSSYPPPDSEGIDHKHAILTPISD